MIQLVLLATVSDCAAAQMATLAVHVAKEYCDRCCVNQLSDQCAKNHSNITTNIATKYLFIL